MRARASAVVPFRRAHLWPAIRPIRLESALPSPGGRAAGPLPHRSDNASAWRERRCGVRAADGGCGARGLVSHLRRVATQVCLQFSPMTPRTVGAGAAGKHLYSRELAWPQVSAE